MEVDIWMFLSQRSHSLWVLRSSSDDVQLAIREGGNHAVHEPRNSTRRRRLECSATILPVATSSAANKVMVPLAWQSWLWLSRRVRSQASSSLAPAPTPGSERLLHRHREQSPWQAGPYRDRPRCGCFRREFRVIALAPGLPGSQINVVLAQEAPNILNVDILQRHGQQRTRPAA